MSTRLIGASMHLTGGERALLPRKGPLSDPKVQAVVQRLPNRKRYRWAREGHTTDLRKLRGLQRRKL